MKKPRPTHLGQMLYEYRTFRRLTLRDVAPQVGISHATLMRIEHGLAFDAETMLKIWNWLLVAEKGQP